MKKLALFLMFASVIAMLSCNGKRHDLAYYERMVDSIRRAEQVKEIEKQAGLHKDPAKEWFDTLHLVSLPIETAGSDVDRIASFTSVPMKLNENFGFPVSAHLKAVALPSYFHHQVVMLCEMQDSVTPALYLYTMDQRRQPIDILTLYNEKAEARGEEDFGLTYNEYFITSKYEIVVMRYFQSRERKRQAVLEQTRLFTINRDGLFEEQVIEL